MSDLRKAAEQALEALEANLGKWRAKTPAIEALRQALAQPEQKREGVGLTDQEVDALLSKLSLGAIEEDVRLTEAKLKEKNT